MKFAKLSFLCAAALMSLSLFAAEVDMIMSIDLPVLMAHPQFVEFRSEFDTKAAEAGTQTLSEKIAEAKIDEELLQNSRLTAYMNVNFRDGVLVIDSPEGEAQKWFKLLCENSGFIGGGTQTSIAGCEAMQGETPEGQKAVILLKSPSQVQLQFGDSVPVPLNVGRINKNLLLASRSGRPFSLAFVPSGEMRTSTQMMPQFQTLQLLSIGLENTTPEATISLTAAFPTEEAALQARELINLMLAGLSQNPAVDGRFLQGFRSSVDAGKLTFTRKLDSNLVDAIRELIQIRLLGENPAETGDAGTAPQLQPQQTEAPRTNLPE